MTPEKALKYLKDMKKGLYLYDDRELLDTVIEIVEKEVPKEPIHSKIEAEYNYYYCPVCGNILASEEYGDELKRKNGCTRCEECIQRIIWKLKR